MTNIKPIEIPSFLEYGNIIEHFERAARQKPEQLAIVDKVGEITFGELFQRVVSAQQQLSHSGLKSGDRVLVFVPMSIDLYVGVLALFRMGCTAVFLDEWSNINRLKLACKIADCRGFIGFPLARFVGFFVGDIRKIPIWISSKNLGKKASQKLGKSIFSRLGSPSRNAIHLENESTSPEKTSLKEIDDDCETALITFTTGSTGTPKAALRTHSFLHEQFLALQTTLQTTDDVVDMPVLPIVLLINLGLGIPSVLVSWNSKKPFKLDVNKVLNRMAQYAVNRIIASPYFIDRMSEYMVSNGVQAKTIQFIFSGGAPVFPVSSRNWVKAFSQAQIRIVYGSTEAEPISLIAAEELNTSNVLQQNGLNVGKVEAVAHVRILKIGTEIEVSNGEIGEIVVSGKHVLRSYYGPDSEKWISESKLFDGDICWHRTGDAGFINENGELHLVGRCGQIINWQGAKLYPFLVEDFLKNLNVVQLGTVMEMDGKLVYFIELKSDFKSDTKLMKSIENEILGAGFPVGELVFWKIPRDPRHFSKIDYGKLRSEAF